MGYVGKAAKSGWSSYSHRISLDIACARCCERAGTYIKELKLVLLDAEAVALCILDRLGSNRARSTTAEAPGCVTGFV
jgi:hypothetical protein